MEPLTQGEIEARIRLIESLVDESRQTTERWGWVFLLWGIGPLFAMVWEARWRHGEWAWTVTIPACVLLNGLGVWFRRRDGEARTTAIRSIGAVWTCAGATVLLIGFGPFVFHTLDIRFLYVGVFALTAAAHGASSIILRWKAQFLAALVWWISTTLALAAPVTQLPMIAACALLLGNVSFGGWLAYSEWRRRDV